jgi:hypothetical protein
VQLLTWRYRPSSGKEKIMPAPAHKTKPQTTTVRLPRRLYEEALSVLEKGATEANSLNDLLVDSLSEKLDQLRREYIDAEFTEMRHDAQYARESSRLAQQFVSNDRDTLRLSEKDKKS